MVVFAKYTLAMRYPWPEVTTRCENCGIDFKMAPYSIKPQITSSRMKWSEICTIKDAKRWCRQSNPACKLIDLSSVYMYTIFKKYSSQNGDVGSKNAFNNHMLIHRHSTAMSLLINLIDILWQLGLINLIDILWQLGLINWLTYCES